MSEKKKFGNNDSYYYEIHDNEVHIIAYKKKDEVFMYNEIHCIPEYINKMPVRVIGKNAFAQSNIRGIIIPGTVREIKSYAFERCLSLENVWVAEGVKIIKDGAFERCRSLRKVIIPENVIIELEDFDEDVLLFLKEEQD